MRRIMHVLGLFVLCLFLSACSWQEYFLLVNNSKSDITVSYKITQAEGFPIFDQEADVYKAKQSGAIDWGGKLPVKDTDLDHLSFTFILPPGSILKFGHLSNDTYHHHDQRFINGRIFNLLEMKILMAKDSLEIKAEQFDHYFKNKKGSIEYLIE